MTHSRIVSFRKVRSLLLPSLLISLAALLPAAASTDHRAAQDWPIQLGTSGGNIFDSSSAFCCSGTLGALVKDGNGVRYILSNNHVIGRSNQGGVDDVINHPGMIDQNCRTLGAVAFLSDFKEILFGKGRNYPHNHVDAAIAEEFPGAVDADGRILGVGIPSSETTIAYVGQTVQKSGRTTGHTFGTVLAVNVMVDVGYSKSCGSGGTDVARFVDQIRIGSGSFSAGGDSGSLVLESANGGADGNPRAIGLLFAGNTASTLANRIDPVLSAFGVKLVGGWDENDPPPDLAKGAVAGTVKSAADGNPLVGATVTSSSGQSAQTDSLGYFELTDVPVGTRVITATMSGYVEGTEEVLVEDDKVSAVNFILEATATDTDPDPPEGLLAIADCIIYTTNGGPAQDRHLSVTVAVVDDAGLPLSGAEVAISLFLNGQVYGSGSGAVTGSDGKASYRFGNAPNGTYSTTVTSITKADYTFDGTELANSFNKGVDPAPAEFCRDSPASNSGLLAGNASIARARQAQREESDRLFGLPDVVGHGIGMGADGEAVLEVYLGRENAATRAEIPARARGVATRVLVTGPFHAY